MVFPLLKFDREVDREVDVAPFKLAARARGVPLKVLGLKPSASAAFCGGLVLSRPDQHVAWRGEKLPDDALALIDRVRGVATRPSVAGIGPAVLIA